MINKEYLLDKFYFCIIIYLIITFNFIFIYSYFTNKITYIYERKKKGNYWNKTFIWIGLKLVGVFRIQLTANKSDKLVFHW